VTGEDRLEAGEAFVRVLIVDDNELIRKMLRAILEPEGLECEEAADASRALAQLVHNPPDLCFMDLHLPDGDGLGILRKLAAIEKERRPTRIYLLTGSDSEGLSQKALELGARAILYKPFTPEQILKAARNP
jgi:CheY-like chemotaxis protein